MAKAIRITLDPGEITPIGALKAGSYGASVLIQNTGTNPVELGGEDLDSDEGFLVVAGGTVGLDLDEGESLYALADSGSTLQLLFTK